MLSSVKMDVYVVPVGIDRYELYCEAAIGEQHASEEPPPEGIIGRLRHKFTAMLRAAEERSHRHHPDPDPHPKGFLARVQDRIMAWVAERIAEQRLLWNLRGKTEVTAMHPDDLTFDQVQTLVQRMLQRDYDRHKVWLVVDSILFVASGVFFFVPGPNLVAYYFGFRVVGHWLSMRGASQGLHVVAWSGRPCPPLTDLRKVTAMQPGEREQEVHAIAERLRLQRFSTFFERVAFANS
jgi:Mitochondrial K+-H+ exchange-related